MGPERPRHRLHPVTARLLAELGYDERFCRLWRLYLSYCEAGFEERRISDVQMLLAKPRWRQAAVQPVSAARNSPRAMISR